MDGGLTIFNQDDGSKEMTFDGTGKIGIGNNNPAAKLHVEGDISSSGDVEALTFTSPTLDVTAGSVQIAENIPLTLGDLVSTDVGKLNIKHDGPEGTTSNNTGDLTITNTGTGDTVIANQGS